MDANHIKELIQECNTMPRSDAQGFLEYKVHKGIITEEEEQNILMSLDV